MPADWANRKLLTERKGHNLARHPEGQHAEEDLYYGDGRTFYAQGVFGGSSEGSTKASLNFWEPRASSPAQAQLEVIDQRGHIKCADRKTELKVVPPDDSATVLARAVFAKPRWKRRAYALARDNNCRNYYVDRLL